MQTFADVQGRTLRLTDERISHVRAAHPELAEPFEYLEETLRYPDRIVRSRTDAGVELYYRHFGTTPVTRKYLCIVAKTSAPVPFIITLYFTDAIKKGDVLWTRK